MIRPFARRAPALLTAALFLSMASPAHAQLAGSRATTADLVKICADPRAPTGSVCSGFLSGAAEGLLMGQLVASDSEPSFCPPEDSILVVELRALFLKYVEAHPERLEGDASLALLDALEAHFPCEQPEDEEAAPALHLAALHRRL